MKEYKKEELVVLWIDSFSGLEYKHKKEIYELIVNEDKIKSALEKYRDFIVQSIGEQKFDILINSANNVYLNYITEGLEKRGITAVTVSSDGYPEKLKNTFIPPLVLYTKGDISLLDTDTIGIVGSRRSLPLSINIAKDYAKELSKSGFTIVTGIAEGVDVSAIQSVLDNGGKIISVIAGGFDNVYPKEHINIFEEVAKNGLCISEQPFDIVPAKYMFPVRNRIIAGLSKGVVIVSGSKKSGALYTAEYAEEYGREVFALPYSVGIASGEGTNDLIKRGAHLTDSVDDVLEFFGKEKKKGTFPITIEEKAVLDFLSDGEKHIEEICNHLNKKIFEVVPMMSVLEIKGAVCKIGTNVYGLIH